MILSRIWKWFIDLFKKSKCVTGKDFKVFLDGRLIGTARMVEPLPSFTVEPIQVLGTCEAVEIAPVVSFEVTVERTMKVPKDE